MMLKLTLFLNLINLSYLLTDTYLLPDGAARFEVTTLRSDDRVETKHEASKTIFDVQSPSGISHANIERTEDKWPEKIFLRLRLKGLENLRLKTQDQTLCSSISSSSADIRQWLDKKEGSPLDLKSPFWMEIRIFDRDGKPTKTLPLQDGYFEMQLPVKFFESNPRSFKLEWIDFYRS